MRLWREQGFQRRCWISPTPQRPRSYGYVFASPIAFDAPRSAVWFDAAQLATPVRRDVAAVRSHLAQATYHVILPRRFDDTVSARVRTQLRNTQPQCPNLAAVATVLNVSTATLQRRLAGEGTPFRTLASELRRDLAITQLVGSNISIKTLAHQLGFETSTSFQRAFKRWTERTPTAYRRTMGVAA